MNTLKIPLGVINICDPDCIAKIWTTNWWILLLLMWGIAKVDLGECNGEYMWAGGDVWEEWEMMKER